MSDIPALVEVLKTRLDGDPLLCMDLAAEFEQAGGLDELRWLRVPGGIEADIGFRTLRVEPDMIVLTNKAFKSSKRIPLA